MGQKRCKLRWWIPDEVRICSRIRKGPKLLWSMIIFFILAFSASPVSAQITNPTYSPVDTMTDNSTVPVPQNVRITLTEGESKASVTWDPVDSAERYLVNVSCNRGAVSCCGPCDFSDESNGNSTEFIFEVDGLTKYDVRVAAIRQNMDSSYTSTVSIKTKARVPQSPEIELVNTNSSITLKWNYSCPYTGPVEYLVSIDGVLSSVFKSEQEESCTYNFTATNLKPFTKVSYSLLAVIPSCQAKCGDIIYSTTTGDFYDESSVTSFETETTFWMVSNETEGMSISTDDTMNQTQSVSSEEAAYEYVTTMNGFSTEENNSPLTNVNCHVCISNITKTLPGVAGKPVINIKGPEFKTDAKMLIWYNLPENSGEVESYMVNIIVGNKTEGCENGTMSVKPCTICPRCNFDARNTFIENTLINTTYRIEVRAKNRDTEEYGPPAEKEFTTGIGWPAFAKPRPFKDMKVTYYSVVFTVLRDIFHESYGPITSFQILLSDKGCQGNDKSSHYIQPDDLNTTKTFQGKIIYNKSYLQGEFLHDKLESSTEYYFKFRLYSYNKFIDSDCFMFYTSHNHLRQYAINISLIIIVFLLVMCAAVLTYRQFYSPYGRLGDSMESPLLLPPVVDASKSRPIALSELSDEVHQLMAEGQTRLKNEYQDLIAASPSKPTSVATNCMNASKNRYINILPFDDTRVILNEYRGIPNSDYFNASYVHGYEKPKMFIACQGPRDREKEDFWRMIWEKNVHVIVMVTKCIESQVEKCSKYWPNSSEKDLVLPKSKLTVSTLEEITHTEEGYICRTIKLSMKQFLIPIPKTRTIKQFHYVLWPDMGCPQHTDHLIHFTNAVEKAIPPKTRTVVHCSAGVGRTGTFIALYNLQEEMKVKSTVDVFQAVYRMRQNRKNMVQTLAQYGFIYKCVQRCEEMRQGHWKQDTQDDPYQQESQKEYFSEENSQPSTTLIELESLSDEEFQNNETTKGDAKNGVNSIRSNTTTEEEGAITTDDVTTLGDGTTTNDNVTT
ncbi:tyrosine-protein phosphatase 10D-like isoform X2 [Palaemon carinicauda]|uniref:tyrosine-protein phosphatase 10D-like isoform X2 n=1 Tax=Palaemon carinicauda TaxID=392227 RepID=UPI0035B606B8